MTAPRSSPPWLPSLFLGILLTLVGTLAALGAYAAHIRCEGFGCTGVGVLWLAWAAMWVVALLLGWALRAATATRPTMRRLTQGAWVTTLLMGGVALVKWLT